MCTTLLKVFVKPNAKKFRHHWMNAHILKVEVPAQPEQNKANEKLVEYLATVLEISSSQIRIKSGYTSRQKHILIPLDIHTIHKKIS